MDEEALSSAVELARLEELICFHAVAALTFSIYDYGLTWIDEVELLWPHTFRSPVKLTFLLNRYSGLLGQIALTMRIVTHSVDTCSIHDSKRLWLLQTSLFCILMICLQAILSLRAYALYIRDSRVASSMLVMLGVQTAALPGLAHFTREMPSGFPGPLCLSIMSTEVGMYYSMIIIPPQIVALALTFHKFITGRRAGFGKTQIVAGLLRDDAAVVLVTLSMLFTVVVSTKIDEKHSLVLYWWMLAIYPAMDNYQLPKACS
ncbi:hypothetical protein CPB83DRAFT_611628 [Crepidotus variabilis]|uniref:DUF6533 domain-containing protein n=1 Tax=Crepidotus variabilis TaxID=179855 RepID=A0A9P6E835_9AGAR|nr:hypothetical protein CPB83DRAFT_611628 [Crepidotus variabilis]